MSQKRRKSKKKKTRKPPKRNRSQLQARPKPVVFKTPQYYLQNARTYPIFGCWMEKGWQEQGLARVVVARQQPDNRIIFAVFIVDHYCLGVKDADVKTDISHTRFRKLMLKIFAEPDGEEPDTCSLEFAHELIFGAVEYARQYGFEPHPDFERATRVLDPPDAHPFTHKLEFGKDGKPFYISGPFDDIDHIMSTLQRTAGEGNYHFLTHIDEYGDEVDEMLDDAVSRLQEEDYEGAIEICEEVLEMDGISSDQRCSALEFMGNAYSMLKDFEVSYELLSKTLEISPDEASLWYNRGITALFSSRTGQALLDFEKAVEMEGKGNMAKEYRKKLKLTKKMVKKEIAQRGPDFSLDQFVEQQDTFQKGVRHMSESRWDQAEQTFRRVIEMGDCMHQPWGNLGLSLLMQNRFDEAEESFKKALEMEPGYEIARDNLAALPEIRRTGQLPMFDIKGPFDDAEIDRSIQFIED